MVITKKSPLSSLIHLRVVNLACLKQCFDDCLFQVSFYLLRKEAQINLITKDKCSEMEISESIIKSSDREKLLGIKIDSKRLF